MHNKRRPHKTNPDSFDTIVRNLSILHKIYPEVELSIRVNIDKDNTDDFFQLYNYLHKIIEGHNFFIYPAFITDFNPCKESFCMLNRIEQSEFALNNKNKYPFGHLYYPITKMGECIARFMNSYIIGPKGEFYKCWCDVGDYSKVTGSLKEGITNHDLYTKYMAGSDPLFDHKCNKCAYFPICNGGCAFKRIKETFKKNKGEVCTIQKDKMEDFIIAYYDSLEK